MNRTRTNIAMLTLALATTATASPTFDDVPTGQTYTAGDSGITNNVPFHFGHSFEQLPNNYVPNDWASVELNTLTCSNGRNLHLANAYVEFDFASANGPVTDPRLFIGWYGGVLNLSINSDRRFIWDINAIPGSIGGCSVQANPLGNGCWVLKISGTVTFLGIGGQELFIDGEGGESEPMDDCDWGYEDLDPIATLPVGVSFTTSGLSSKVHPFTYLNGTVDTTGRLSTSLLNMACSTGLEVQTENAVLYHNLTTSVGKLENVSWDFHYQGGDINFAVNGSLQAVSSIWSLHGKVINGCLISVVPHGGGCGTLHVDGVVSEIALGGQELHIDCLNGDPAAPATPGDVDGDDDVDVDDLMQVIASWGNDCDACPADIDTNGVVNVDDLMILLGNFGS